jgi:hypothetical protein
MKLPIDTSAIAFLCALAPEPVIDFETRRPKADENGEPLYVIQLLAMGDGSADLLAVKVPGVPPGIRQGHPVKVQGRVPPKCRDGRCGWSDRMKVRQARESETMQFSSPYDLTDHHACCLYPPSPPPLPTRPCPPARCGRVPDPLERLAMILDPRDRAGTAAPPGQRAGGQRRSGAGWRTQRCRDRRVAHWTSPASGLQPGRCGAGKMTPGLSRVPWQ